MTKTPNRLLDMCAAPGGKLLAAHDLFPGAILFANDSSEKRIAVLRENIEKYRVPAILSVGDGLQFRNNELFDLIILDAPCSNSGVLNKRPEARWRLTESQLQELEQQEKALLERAISLTKPGGEIWYLTCSILMRENQSVVNEAVAKKLVAIREQEVMLPNKEGWDGGYGCALVKL